MWKESWMWILSEANVHRDRYKWATAREERGGRRKGEGIASGICASVCDRTVHRGPITDKRTHTHAHTHTYSHSATLSFPAVPARQADRDFVSSSENDSPSLSPSISCSLFPSLSLCLGLVQLFSRCLHPPMTNWSAVPTKSSAVLWLC